MARKPRIEYPGAFFHIIVRGNNRENVFRDGADYVHYLEKFFYLCQEGDITVYAYCLMPNHIHLLLEIGKGSLSKVLQRFHTWYTQYFNRRYDRVGHLFQGRYKAIVCNKDAYLLELVRYIHLNPVRAGLVDSPEDYAWSSHRIFLGIDKSEAIDPSFVLKQFSDDLSAAIRSYELFVMEMAMVHFELDELEKIMQGALGLEPGSLRSGGRFNTWFRRIFCYIARTYGAHKGKDVAAYIGRDLATVTYSVRFVENLLRAGDQKTINAIARIRDRMKK